MFCLAFFVVDLPGLFISCFWPEFFICYKLVIKQRDEFCQNIKLFVGKTPKSEFIGSASLYGVYRGVGKCREISRLVGLRGNPEHSRQPAILTGLEGLIYRLLIDDLSTVHVTGIT